MAPVAAGLLDPDQGTLPRRLRRHLLRPGTGRLQELVLALQYLIEAFPVEQLDKPERRAYLAAIRERLQAKNLSTRFHALVGELSAGLGMHYQQVRYYKARIDDPDHPLLNGDHGALGLSERIGYEAGTDDKIVVRLSELFLVESDSGDRYSGKAWVDGVPRDPEGP